VTARGGAARAAVGDGLDRELTHLTHDARMAEWSRRIFAVLFASADPVDRPALASLIGRDVAVEAVITTLRATLADGSVEVARVGGGWMLRTRAAYADAIRLALGTGAGDGGADAAPEEMTPRELAVLAAIAYFQPVSRAGLGEALGQVPGDALLRRLRDRGLIAAGPRSPARGAPRTFVTTPAFLATFDYEDIAAFTDDIPDLGEGAGRLRDGSGGLV
jgi:chromosome segregation and condensation protein ScpB